MMFRKARPLVPVEGRDVWRLQDVNQDSIIPAKVTDRPPAYRPDLEREVKKKRDYLVCFPVLCDFLIILIFCMGRNSS